MISAMYGREAESSVQVVNTFHNLFTWLKCQSISYHLTTSGRQLHLIDTNFLRNLPHLSKSRTSHTLQTTRTGSVLLHFFWGRERESVIPVQWKICQIHPITFIPCTPYSNPKITIIIIIIRFGIRKIVVVIYQDESHFETSHYSMFKSNNLFLIQIYFDHITQNMKHFIISFDKRCLITEQALF